MNAVDRGWMRGIWLASLQAILPLVGVVFLTMAGIASAQIVGQVAVPLPNALRAVHEIDDPSLGKRWLLVRDPDQPQAPGHLLCTERIVGEEQTLFEWRRSTSYSLAISPPFRSVIRSGDSLIVEDETQIAIARLGAVALGPAAVGSVFLARLRIGGTPIRVIAIAPGRAMLLPKIGVQP